MGKRKHEKISKFVGNGKLKNQENVLSKIKGINKVKNLVNGSKVKQDSAKKKVRFSNILEYNDDPKPVKKPKINVESDDDDDEISDDGQMINDEEELDEDELSDDEQLSDDEELPDDEMVGEELSENEEIDDEEVSDEEEGSDEEMVDEEPKVKSKKGQEPLPNGEGDQPDKKTSKEAHQEQKKTKEDRKKKENKFYELGIKAKRIWEEVRRDDCSETKRIKMMDELISLVKGHVKEIIRAHDTARVIECIVAMGTDKHRTILFDELKPILLELTKSKYSKFFVLKMLRYGNRDQKAKIIESFYGNVIKLMTHKEASAVVEFAYNDVANANQRAQLVQEFFGSNFVLFKDKNVLSLDQALKSLDSEVTKKQILTKFKDNLVKIADKTIFKHSIAHFLYRELFKHADNDLKSELVDALHEVIVEMVHTKDGARVACEVLWAANAKQRKLILKSMKKWVPKVVEEEHGYLVLLAAFDCVDDTKLIEKTIISELFNAQVMLSLAQSKNGLKVFEYLLAPRDSRFFHKDLVSILAVGDDNQNSKKERTVRERELLLMATPHFYQLIVNHGDILMKNNACCLLISLIMQKASSEGELAKLRKQALEALIKPIQEEGLYYEAKEEANMHPIERNSVSLLFRKLVGQDKEANGVPARPGEKVERTVVQRTAVNLDNCFSECFVNCISKEVLRSYVNCNKGCFLLLNLLETEIEPIKKKLFVTLKGLNKTLSRKDYKGASLLLEYLKKSNVE